MIYSDKRTSSSKKFFMEIKLKEI